MSPAVRSLRDALLVQIPGLALVMVGVLLSDPGLMRALIAAGLLSIVLAALGSLLSHLAAEQSMRHLMLAMVVGMLLRLGGVALFCVVMSFWPEVHLIAACLAAAGGVLLCLLIDSACLAQRLSHFPPSPQQSSQPPHSESETAGA